MPFLVIASFFFSAWISIVLHESSHALAGHLANLQIREFRVGLGPTLLHTRLLGMEVRVGTIPIAGRVSTFPQLFYSKSANLLLVAAGPAMDVVWLVVLLGAMSFYQDSQLAGSILAPAIIVQIMVVIGNVFPHSLSVYGQRTPNDMLAFWKIVWKEHDPSGLFRQSYLNALRKYMSPGDPPWQATGQSDRVAFYFATPDLTDEDLPALEADLAATSLRSERLFLIDTTATNILARPAQSAPRLNAYLDRLTESSVAMAPELRTLKGTRGALLARLGRHEEALNVLAEADESDDLNRCLNAAFRALAHHHAGRKDLAAAELETAIAILRSNDQASQVGRKIVNAVCAEIGYPALEEYEPPKPENLAPPSWIARKEA